MELEEVIKRIKENKDLLKEKFKVKEIGVFGSVTWRGEKVNDIDVIVEFSEPVGWEIVDLKGFLEDLLGVKVDLLTKKAVMSKQHSGGLLRRRLCMSNR